MIIFSQQAYHIRELPQYCISSVYFLLILIILLKYYPSPDSKILKYLVHSTELEAAGALCIQPALDNPQTFVKRIPFEVSSNCEKKKLLSSLNLSFLRLKPG